MSYGATVPAAVVFKGPDATLSIPLEIKPQNALGEPLRVAGLVTLTTADGKPAGSAEFVIPLKHLEASTDSTPPKSAGGKS